MTPMNQCNYLHWNLSQEIINNTLTLQSDLNNQLSNEVKNTLQESFRNKKHEIVTADILKVAWCKKLL